MSVQRPILLILACSLASGARGSDLHVPGDYPGIQLAIQSAQDGDRVIVGPGTWFENLDFLGKEITLVSEVGPTSTILDGSNANNVVRFTNQEGPGARLEGFTIQNGTPAAAFPDNRGGGIYIIAASPRIIDNIIIHNHAFDTAGIYVNAGNPLIEGNAITDNEAGDAFPGGITMVNSPAGVIRGNVVSRNIGYGIRVQTSSCMVEDNVISDNGVCYTGGLICHNSSATIRRNTITHNNAGCGGGGGVTIIGGGQTQLLDNVIAGNLASYGGGISLWGAGSPLIRGNVIRRNSATDGGGISFYNFSDAIVERNIISDNSATTGGAMAIYTPAGATGPMVVNNTIVGNRGYVGAAIFARGFDGQMVIKNNIIASGSGAPPLETSPDYDPDIPRISYNNVWTPSGNPWGGNCPNLTGVDGNISQSPQLADPAHFNYELARASPCIDAGDPLGPADPDSTLPDLGALPFNHCGDYSTYCYSTPNSAGCTPRIAATGSPNISGPGDFRVYADQVPNRRLGFMTWSLSPSAQPFSIQGACLGPNVVRTGMNWSGGSPTGTDCSGRLMFECFAPYLDAHQIGPFTTVYAQFRYRDPLVPGGLGATDALRFVRCP